MSYRARSMVARPTADLAAPWYGGARPHYTQIDDADVYTPSPGDGLIIYAKKSGGNDDSNEEEQWKLDPETAHPKMFIVFELDILLYAQHASGEGDLTWRSYHDGAWSSFTPVGTGVSYAWFQRNFPYSPSKKWGWGILDDWRMGVKTPTLNNKGTTHSVDTAYGIYRWWWTQAAITI